MSESHRLTPCLKGLAMLALHAWVIFAAITLAGGTYYWIGWPQPAREIIGLGAFPILLALWFWPGRSQLVRRGVALTAILAFMAAYYTKPPASQDWVPLHERRASAEFSGDLVTIHNFRDAIHHSDAPVEVDWRDETFDLSRVETAELIIQPFGDGPFLTHIFITFGFDDGTQLAVSVEARRVSWDRFQPIGGFFRFFETYPVFGTERDLIGKRLAHVPPEEMYFYPLLLTPQETRSVLEDLLRFTTDLAETPDFYDTLEESCFTGLVNQSSVLKSRIPSWDIRRWIPGYALPLMRDHGLISNALPLAEQQARAHLPNDVPHPFSFETDRAFSLYLREQLR